MVCDSAEKGSVAKPLTDFVQLHNFAPEPMRIQLDAHGIFLESDAGLLFNFIKAIDARL